MLSKKIYNLRQRLADYTHGGVTLSGKEVDLFVGILDDCEAQARQMELSTIPVPLTLNAEHLTSGKVIAFPIIPHQTTEEDGVAS